jgi:hypothetical protein
MEEWVFTLHAKCNQLLYKLPHKSLYRDAEESFSCFDQFAILWRLSLIVCVVVIWCLLRHFRCVLSAFYRGADKSLARPGRKQATAEEDFDVHISYL